jgi:putative salt-induced outer membrane protein YdiY
MLHLALLLCSLPTNEDPLLPRVSELPPEELSSVAAQDPAAPAEEKPENKNWTGAVALGATYSDGNTNVKRASATFDATKTNEKNRYTLGFAYNRAEEEGVVTQDRSAGKAQYDRFINEKSYFLALITGEKDEQADLDLRWTAGVGYGYQFRNDDVWKLAGEVGLSYYSEDFSTGEDSEYVAARLGWNADWKASKFWEFLQSGQVLPSLEDSEDIYVQVDTRVKATLTDTMFAQLQWVYSWDNTPAAGKERVDNLYVLTVGWTF